MLIKICHIRNFSTTTIFTLNQFVICWLNSKKKLMFVETKSFRNNTFHVEKFIKESYNCYTVGIKTVD